MKPPSSSSIQSQVKLPFTVALEVVLQGIRIRMGRSVVTMMGVVLGVAFLMSVFTANVIRSGMQEERELRREVQRMFNFLEAETGNLTARNLGVVVGGNLSNVEQRLLTRIDSEGISEIRLFPASAARQVPPLGRVRPIDNPTQLGEEASGLLLLGEGPVPAIDWAVVAPGLRQRILAHSRDSHAGLAAPGLTMVRLDRALRAEETARLAEQARQERARHIWIVSIALLVTIIGITNSLLMSVTERFKEIGTMKCLGALSSFIRQIFFIESALTGFVGSVIGGVVGFLVAAVVYAFTFGFGLVFVSMGRGEILALYFLSVGCGIAMSIIAAIYPASFASRMVPATALRTNI
jgi:hypothetical protein